MRIRAAWRWWRPIVPAIGRVRPQGGGMTMALGIAPRGDGYNPASLVFPNGSRIVGLPGVEGTVRGFSAMSMLLIDEASRVQDPMYKALRPMLAVGNGGLWLLSTPYRAAGFFYKAWVSRECEWYKVRVPATECPRISKTFLEEDRGQLRRDFEIFVEPGAVHIPPEICARLACLVHVFRMNPAPADVLATDCGRDHSDRKEALAHSAPTYHNSLRFLVILLYPRSWLCCLCLQTGSASLYPMRRYQRQATKESKIRATRPLKKRFPFLPLA